MAISQTVEWDVESGGNDNNGGGFNTSAAGTDRSQQTAAFIVFDGVTITATGITSVVTLTGYTVVAADVGNVLNITGGTNFTPGRYEITATGGGNTWSLDRVCCTAAATAMTGNMGGCFATIQAGINAQSATGSPGDQIVWVKKATYSISAAITSVAVTLTFGLCRVYGYQTTHGDNPTGSNRPTISVTAAVKGVDILNNSGWSFVNFIIDGTSTGTIGVDMEAAFGLLKNCKVANFTGRGVYVESGGQALIDVEVTGCAGSFGALDLQATCQVTGCWSHNNTNSGIGVNAVGVNLSRSVASGNGQDGINVGANEVAVDGCVSYGNTRDGIRLSAGVGYPQAAVRLFNNISVGNSGFGVNSTTATALTAAWSSFDYNAFFNNTSGSYHNITAGTHDVALTGDPFTAAGSNDFTLNNTAGAGAACRAAGFPGVLNSLSLTGYADIGTLQHQDSGGAAGMLFIPNLEGT